MKIKKEDLVKVLMAVKGNTFVSFLSCTTPKLTGGKTNPFVGTIKESKVSGAIGFNYSNSVNNQRKREGIEEEFIPGGITPLFLKAKCQSFLLAESKQLDSGVVDIETLESQGNEES